MSQLFRSVFYALLTGALLVFMPSVVLAGSLPYPDIDTYQGHFEAIYQTKQMGIFSGYPDGTFGGYLEINRAELAKVLVLASGVTEEEVEGYASLGWGGLTFFSDVDYDAWYADYVVYAQVEGWIDGYPDGTFKPGNSVNLAEALKMIVGALYGEPDYSGTQWYDGYVLQLMNHGILRVGAGEAIPSTFTSDEYLFFKYLGAYLGSLSDDVSRDEVAELLYLVSISVEENDFYDYSPYMNSEEYADWNGVVLTEQEGAFNLADSLFNFSISDVAMEDFSLSDLRFYMENPSGFQNGYVTYIRFLFPSDSVYFGEDGYADLFTVSVYDEDYYEENWDEYYGDADFKNGGYAYKVSCGQEAPDDLYDLRTAICQWPLDDALQFQEALDFDFEVSDADTSGYTRYDVYDHGYAIETPEDWTYELDPDDYALNFTSVDNGVFFVVARTPLSDEEQALSMEELAESFIAIYVDIFGDFTVVDVDSLTFAGEDGYGIYGTYEYDGTVYWYNTIFTVIGDKGYMMVYSYDVEADEDYSEAVERVLESFEFLG